MKKALKLDITALTDFAVAPSSSTTGTTTSLTATFFTAIKAESIVSQAFIKYINHDNVTFYDNEVIRKQLTAVAETFSLL